MKETMMVEAQQVGEQVAALLADHSSIVQGVVLAEMLAIWLAGHIMPGDTTASDQLREDILRAHLRMVHTMVPLHVERIHGGAS